MWLAIIQKPDADIVLMMIFLLFVISFVGAGMVTRVEISRNIPQIRSRFSFMGQWPYNIVLLAGVAVCVLTSGRPYETIAQGIVLVATLVFYAVTLYRLSKD